MKQTHILYGFITGISMIILGVILYIAGLAFKPGVQYLVYIPFFIGVIINANAFSKANDGFVTFGNVFSSCFKACAIITIVGLAWGFISLMIFPEMLDKIMEMSRDGMEKKNMSSEQIEQGMEFMKKYFKVFMIGGIVFFYMLLGAVFSLIGAAIAKKKGTNPNMGM
jgi:hypothetical protein